MTSLPDKSTEKVEAFVARWQGQEGGQERANYSLFLTELCDVLELPHPDPAGATRELNDYAFERVVTIAMMATLSVGLTSIVETLSYSKPNRVAGKAAVRPSLDKVISLRRRRIQKASRQSAARPVRAAPGTS
jgi:hypothetical protein